EPTWSMNGIEKPQRDTPPPAWRCKQCGAVNSISAKICGECEIPRPVIQCAIPSTQAGRLAELTPERVAWLKRATYREAVTGPLSKTELQIVAQIRGYRRGWVNHVLRERGVT